MPAIDRDESRFTQASRQMVCAHKWTQWMVPQVQDQLRLNKPPLIYWAQASSASLFTGRAFGVDPDIAKERDAIWMYRLPSLLAAIAAVLFTWRLGCSMFDPRAGFLGALLLAASPVMVWEARQGRADMLLVACTTGAMWALWEGFKQSRAHGRVHTITWIGLWLALGLGALTKGPITAMIVLFTTLGVSILTHSFKWTWKLKPLVGALIVEACVIPWILVVIGIVGSENYWRIIHDELIKRFHSPAEGHGGPPGYHTLLMVVLLGAGSLLIWPALLRAVRLGFTSIKGQGLWKRLASLRLARPAEGFLLCWIIPAWLVFEISSTKLPHYTMPLYPALALLAGRAVLAADAGSLTFRFPRVIKALSWTWLVALSGALIFFGMLATYSLFRTLGPAASTVFASLWMIGVGLLAFKAATFLNQGRWLFAQRTGIAMTVGISLALGIMGSLLPEIRVSRNLATKLHEIDPTHQRPIIAVEYPSETTPGARDQGGFVEDSLIFETRGRTRRLNGDDFPVWITNNPSGLVCIEERALKRYVGVPREAPLPDETTFRRLHILDMVPGFNYSKGKLVKVYIAEVLPPGAAP